MALKKHVDSLAIQHDFESFKTNYYLTFFDQLQGEFS